MVKQTAGRDALNDFAPKFAALNDGGRLYAGRSLPQQLRCSNGSGR